MPLPRRQGIFLRINTGQRVRREEFPTQSLSPKSQAVFNTRHTFPETYAFVGTKGVGFGSTTGEEITASQDLAKDGMTTTIVFVGERTRRGNVCKACWGFRNSCNQSRIGQRVETLDSVVR